MTHASTPTGLPTVLVPGLFCTPRCFEHQVNALWSFGPVMVADHTRDDRIVAIAQRVLSHAPPRFALAGLSMGGYIALEIMRQAPQRVARLALICTNARPDSPEQSERRRQQIELTHKGRFADIARLALPLMFSPQRDDDPALRQIVNDMTTTTGPEAFVRQQTAIIERLDSRPYLGAITCPTLVIAAENDALMPPEVSAEMTQGIAGAQQVTVSDCGHLSTLEQPEAVSQALVEFWRAHGA
jgi:pimeloyl-ACP methyl ester carboxylesterase